MNIKKYFSLFNVKNHILDVIETLNIDSETLLSPEEKNNAATNLINVVSRLSGAISFQPLPFADTLIITPIQVSLVMKIAQIYNRKLDKRVIQEIVSTVIKAILARTMAKNIIKFVPLIGAPICFIISYITTNSIGLTAIRIFENSYEFDIEEVKEIFEKEYNKISTVNIIIGKSISIPHKEIKSMSIVRKSSGADLRAVHEETKKTILYLPSAN